MKKAEYVRLEVEIVAAPKGSTRKVSYAFVESPVGGEMLAAWTAAGLCSLEFVNARADALEALRRRFPAATFEPAMPDLTRQCLTLSPEATPFQLSVWRRLLKVPAGTTVTYGSIARAIGSPRSARAVGRAVGANPVALLIPCHRIVAAGGPLPGSYRWGADRKAALLALESASNILHS